MWLTHDTKRGIIHTTQSVARFKGGENVKRIDINVVAQRLKNLRQESGKTITQVSEETGIGRTALANYESGLRIPRDEAKVVIAEYYNRTVDDIFFSA